MRFAWWTASNNFILQLFEQFFVRWNFRLYYHETSTLWTLCDHRVSCFLRARSFLRINFPLFKNFDFLNHTFFLALARNRVAYDYLIMGFPMCIEGRKYHRNGLLWNLGFILDKNMNPAIFEPILRKLGSLLKNLEVRTRSSSILSLPTLTIHLIFSHKFLSKY